MNDPGNVYSSKRGIKLEVQFIFTSCLGIVEPGKLFPITVEKFYLETTTIIKQYICGRHRHIGTEIEFAGFFSFRIVVSNMNQSNYPLEGF